jgi:hypothetical protein
MPGGAAGRTRAAPPLLQCLVSSSRTFGAGGAYLIVWWTGLGLTPKALFSPATSRAGLPQTRSSGE